MDLITINKGEKWYHSSYGFKGLQSDRFIFLSKNPNYSRHVIDIVHKFSKMIVNGCCSYDLNSPIYEFTLINNITLINTVNELYMNYFTDYVDVNLYCNIKNIDGFYTNNGFYNQEIMCVYVRDSSILNIEELKNYNEVIPIYKKIYITITMILCQIIQLLFNIISCYKMYSNINKSIFDYNQINILNMKNNFYNNNQMTDNDILNFKNINNVKIMTYNVHGFSNVFNKDTKREIIKLIINIQPDVCCLQESFYLSKNEIQGYKMYKILSNVILVKKNHCIISYKYKKLPGSFDIYRWVQCVTLKIYGKTYNIFNVHLDPWDLTGKKKYEQFKFILNMVNKPSCNNVVLLGDFNDINMNDYNNDQKTYMKKYENKFISKYNFNNELPNNFIDIFKGNNCSCWTNKRVDYIFCDSNINKKYIGNYILQYNYSDHLPLIVILQQ